MTPGSSVCRISQETILEWVAIPFSRESSDTGIILGFLHCRQILIFTIWATGRVLVGPSPNVDEPLSQVFSWQLLPWLATALPLGIQRRSWRLEPWLQGIGDEKASVPRSPARHQMESKLVGLYGASNIWFIDLDSGYMHMFSLWKFTNFFIL